MCCYIISCVCAVSDVNECDANTHNCNNNADCFNTNGSFVCNCSDGFSGNGVFCEGMQTIIFLGQITNRGEKYSISISEEKRDGVDMSLKEI